MTVGSLCQACGNRFDTPCVYPFPEATRPLNPDGGCITLPPITVSTSGEECSLGLCGTLNLPAGFTATCDPDTGSVTLTPKLGCGLRVNAAGEIEPCAQSLTMFDSGVNIVVNTGGFFDEAVVPVTTILEDCSAGPAGCEVAVPDSGGIRVTKDGVYTINSYSSIPEVQDGGPTTMNRYRHRLLLDNVISGRGWPGTSTNLRDTCDPCSLEGAVGNTSQTLCLDAGTLIEVQVATSSYIPEPITVTSVGLGVTYHGTPGCT